MIESFTHKGLKELFEKGRTSKLPQERLDKINKILTVLDNAEDLRDFNIPAFRFHKLKKPPLAGYYSLDVTGNYRIVFCFDTGKVTDVDYLDTH